MLTSTFTWLDYSEQDRKSMLDVIYLLGREHDTRDELGIGAIRDALAELLFPGVNTIQTRARYFLFVPWVYLALERERVPSQSIVRQARNAELDLIAPLKASGAEGVFGDVAGRHLQRLPSSIYWYGLCRWRIHTPNETQAAYHRRLDGFYRNLREIDEHRREEGGQLPHNWRPGIPEPPRGFPVGATFDLTRQEAEYLRERILTEARGTLLAYLAGQLDGEVKVDFPWLHPEAAQATKELRQQITYAREFSQTMYGAALLYNLMLAQAAHWQPKVEEYQERLLRWSRALAQRRPGLLEKDRASFWATVSLGNPHALRSARPFVDHWLNLIGPGGAAANIAANPVAHRLISEREFKLKRDGARLHNRRALELWGGAAGAVQLSYRWRNVQNILNDLAKGLRQETAHA